MKKIALTKYRIRWIAKVKDVYDFSTQIENDFLILSIMAIRSVIVKNKKAPASFVIARIREICQHPEFVKIPEGVSYGKHAAVRAGIPAAHSAASVSRVLRVREIILKVKFHCRSFFDSNFDRL